VLAPVLFPPGASDLDAAAERRLDLLAVLLGQKRDLVLDLTGTSGALDAAALGDAASPDALATLARARADAVRQRLVERYRIDPARLRVADAVRTDADASVALTPATD
jgi:outer membrane protein OmpA-like peptidoglycan-associated protein